MKSIRKRSFSGESKAKYVKLYFKRDDLTWLVRANEIPDNIRSPISAGEAKKIISHMKNWHGKFSESWKVRATANQAKFDKGDPFGFAEVCKGLSVMKEEGTLSATDRQHLNRSIEFLSEELAHALGKTEDQVRLVLEKAAASQTPVKEAAVN